MVIRDSFASHFICLQILQRGSHFICLQILQRGSSTERLILSASKYSRYIFRGRNVQFFIGTRQEKGRVECLLEIQIFYQGIIAQIFGKKYLFFLKVRFHHEGGLSQSRYFGLFFSKIWVISFAEIT